MTLKAARTNVMMTQAQAAKALGISTNTLVKYENGRTFPDVPLIKKMEKLYGIRFADMEFFLQSDYS